MRQPVMNRTGEPARSFDACCADDGQRLRRAVVARYGVDVGGDVWADALAYAWQHWDRIGEMDNPVGSLYRVAQTSSRRHRRWRRPPRFPSESLVVGPAAAADDRLDLGHALARLSGAPRLCIVLVHVYGWPYADVAQLLGTTTGAVRNHLHRGLARMRQLVEN